MLTLVQSFRSWSKDYISFPTVAQTNAFTWFADDVAADRLLTNKPLCYFELNNNERITTRTQDITAQLNPSKSTSKKLSTRAVKCENKGFYLLFPSFL